MRKFPVGVLVDEIGPEWGIVFDFVFDDSLPTRGLPPHAFCRHCHSRRVSTDVPPHHKAPAVFVTCPRAIVVANVSGGTDTYVCLDCILEAAAGLPPAPKEEN